MGCQTTHQINYQLRFLSRKLPTLAATPFLSLDQIYMRWRLRHIPPLCPPFMAASV